MAITLPVVVCFIGTAADLYIGLWLRKFKISAIPPKSRAQISREERQQRVSIASRIAFSMAIFLLLGAALLAWLAN